MSCPAITVGPGPDFSKCKTFYYTTEKKHARVLDHGIYGMMGIPYESEQERFDNISDWAMAILNKFGIKTVCLEGYSMGSKGKVFNIAENTGLLKYKMWQAGIEVCTPAPTSVKKHFCGKGNAKKGDMHDAFVMQTGVDVAELVGKSKDTSPVSDIVDSYAMLDYWFKNG